MLVVTPKRFAAPALGMILTALMLTPLGWASMIAPRSTNVVASSPSSAAAALRLAPTLLAEYCWESELIAVVRVGRTLSHEPHPYDEFGCNSVQLELQDCLKGNADRPLVVHYDENVACPPPASYREGDIQLVFLARGRYGGYVTLGGRSGTMLLEARELAVMTDRIRELLPLQAANKRLWRNSNALLEWALRCIEEPSTLNYGYLTIKGGFWVDGIPLGYATPSFTHRLSTVDMLRILFAIEADEDLSLVDVQLLQIIKELDNPRYEPFLMQQIRSLKPRDRWKAYDLIKILAGRWDDDYLKELLRVYWRDRKAEGRSMPNTRIEPLIQAFFRHTKDLETPVAGMTNTDPVSRPSN